MADAVEVVLWVFTGTGSTTLKKITVKVGKEMLFSAYLNWQVQIFIKMIGGESFEEAVSDVNVYQSAIWSGLTSVVEDNRSADALNCIKSTVDILQKNKEYDYSLYSQVFVSCVIQFAKTELFNKILLNKNSPYSKALVKAFEGERLEDVRKNIRILFNCTNNDIDLILKQIPKEILNQLIK